MSITWQKKEKIVSELNQILKDHQYLYFVDLANAKTLALTAFKRMILDLGAKYKVVKKNLLKIGLKENKIEFPGIDDYSGSFGVVYANGNEIDIAKVIDKFIKENSPKTKIKDSLSILAAIFEKAFIKQDDAKKLSKIPSKEILHGQLVNVLVSPIAGLAYVCSGTIQKFLLTLKEIEKTKASN
ncbi:MAG: 50S ribosomal protein L10 [Candidatus Brennerbacteria bacterium RIFOXYC1_FULL_41_11]|uniref:Large ribosomal subunit protein uL10 n=1 Tax=Candidatus Brennerbacteria bacterium RIFOXYD1_FULL_41_16 TaxID=1797529 RepID=A0A1G1XLE9_9BACT|nr:MAG: 50S ribosomal protein L10 [Candidatus Brennerbacteria bacterium RIFOXYB1_FULL_41_13]OGY40409.1 MAG: 50S ribosomal protein L10 [Candidatus Brennerbacteria bacterium RIFOXYC1_FULL_41_11]OGY40838.1 MAG: 50S ribosomal protein L10 [Candidatus Brennerbacteria bacterium RIFOXYD1_FULL_41_16]